MSLTRLNFAKDCNTPHRSIHETHYSEISSWIRETVQRNPSKLLPIHDDQLTHGFFLLAEFSRRVSFTSDVWSKTDILSCMAVTAHYLMTCEGYLILWSRLVAFSHIKGSHTGDHLTDISSRVIQELKVLDRVSARNSMVLCQANAVHFRLEWLPSTMRPMTTPR